MSDKILYEDKDVKVTSQFIYIKWYFFPVGSAKKIPIKDILKVQKRQLGYAKYRLWGMDAGDNWGYWLAGDKKRPSYKHYIGITIPNSSIHPSFTSASIDTVYNLIKELVSQNREQGTLGEIRGENFSLREVSTH